jgi:hypothetical protein
MVFFDRRRPYHDIGAFLATDSTTFKNFTIIFSFGKITPKYLDLEIYTVLLYERNSSNLDNFYRVQGLIRKVVDSVKKLLLLPVFVGLVFIIYFSTQGGAYATNTIVLSQTTCVNTLGGGWDNTSTCKVYSYTI